METTPRDSDVEDEDEEIVGEEIAPTEAREIPFHEWSAFFQTFSHDHEGEIVSLETDAAGGRSDSVSETDVVAHGLPFSGVSTDFGDGPDGAIQIMLGSEPDDHITHLISEPTHVWLYQSDEGETEVLEIESVGGPTTMVYF